MKFTVLLIYVYMLTCSLIHIEVLVTCGEVRSTEVGRGRKMGG